MGLEMERRGCDVGRVGEADDTCGMCMGYEMITIPRGMYIEHAHV